jgi:hypothetical protein
MSSGPLVVAGFLVNQFSSVNRQREPPSSQKTNHIRLVTILPSPFCEKARWALDLCESKSDNPYYYTEDAHPPALHAFATMPVSNDTSSATPMVIYKEEKEDGTTSIPRVLVKSDAILKQFLPELYPPAIADQVQAMESDFGIRVGTAGRTIAYHMALSNLDRYKSTLINWSANPVYTSKVENILFDKMLDKGLAKGLRRGVRVTQEGSDASVIAVRECFAEISAKLEASGGEYILDTPTQSYGFTAADLTFAANAALILCPPELENLYGRGEEEVGEDTDTMEEHVLLQLRKELLPTRAGQHVLTMYQKHRLSREERDKGNGKVCFKTVDRNKYPWQFS